MLHRDPLRCVARSDTEEAVMQQQQQQQQPTASSPAITVTATTSAAPVCLVTFTGFREEDEEDGNTQSAYAAMAAAVPGVRVEATLSSSTTVLVARRGFTRRRLLAARQGTAVVLPRWVSLGCPVPSETASTATYDLHAVPWLHGYVFCTSGMSTPEKATIDTVCAAHGAVVEPALTHRCDVLLVTAACVQALQRLRGADELGDEGHRCRHVHLRSSALLPLDRHADAPAAAADGHGEGQSSAATWLTEKVRVALELDIAVVDYVRLFAMLRLDRLPPPNTQWGRGAADRRREHADALSGMDLDTLVESCRVGAPREGRAAWPRLLATVANAAPSAVGLGVSLHMARPLPTTHDNDNDDDDDDDARRVRSADASSHSCSDSTVSDPDAWEDFISSALAPLADAYDDTDGTADHLTQSRSGAARAPAAAHQMSTADTVDVADAVAEAPSTLHVHFPDYYSDAAAQTVDDASAMLGRVADDDGGEVVLPLAADAPARWDLAGVDASPRLSTNALLHGGPVNGACVSRGQRALSPAAADVCTGLSVTQVLVDSCGDGEAHEAAPSPLLLPPLPPTTARRTTTARPPLPLCAMHPPYLTVCVMGCTDAERREAAVWTEQCRLLRTPVPTTSTDVVVLGSRVLARRRYTVHPATAAAGATRALGTGIKRRHLRPRRDGGDGGAAVTLRCWEMDAAVARALLEVCGIAQSRLAPLRWLEDAAAAAQRRAREAALASNNGSGGGEYESRRDADTLLTMSTSTLPDTLAAAAAAAGQPAEAAVAPPPPFYPLPPLTPDELPNLADVRYYIRLRRSAAGDALAANSSGTGATRTATAAAPPAPSVASPQSPAVADVSSGAGAPAESHDAATWRGGDVALHIAATPATTGHSSATVGVACDASPRVAGTAAPVRGRGAPGVATVPPPVDQQHEAALATAGRRFNDLLALLRVCDGDGDEGESSVTRHRDRAPALASCCFCCVDGEFARVDWAVVRGLVRFGGGRVEKRKEEEWIALLQHVPSEPHAPHRPSADTAAPGLAAQQQETAEAEEEQRCMRALRHHAEYVKLQRKLLRIGGDAGGTPASCLPTPTDASAAAAAVKRLDSKLRRAAERCRQSPVLRLLPHSFQRASADEGGDAAVARDARASRAPAASSPRRHVLHRLAAVTMDYVLACAAVGHSLDPRRCFLFHTSIPSAPDVQLLRHHGADHARGRGAVASPPCRPALSRWVLERRYTKSDSVGVCLSVLWKLPPPPTSADVQHWSRVADASAVASLPCLTPTAELVPLLRVLLLGLRNAAEALGGHVVDAFTAAAVTHVVVVDISCIVSGTLQDLFECSDGAAAAATTTTGAARGTAEDSADGRAVLAYWPPHAVNAIVQCAARDEVAVVDLAWLATCVQWGAFVDESAVAPPPELHTLLQAAQQQQQRTAAGSRLSDAARDGRRRRRAPWVDEGAEEKGRDAVHPFARVERPAARMCTPPPPRHAEHRPATDDVGDAAAEELNSCRTPVRRRRHGSAADCAADACTPPVRVTSSTASHPPTPPSAPLRSPSLDSRTAAAAAAACHRHGRSPTSASQHNTRTPLEQRDADAYVEHLGGLFNFMSPGSTPLPSSALANRGRSTAAYADRRTISPCHPRDSPRSHGPPPPRSPNRVTSGVSSASQHTPVLTPPLRAAAAPSSSALSTPRPRRTLRGTVAAAAAASAAHATPPSPSPPIISVDAALTSPVRRRSRTEVCDIDDSNSSSNARAQTSAGRWRSGSPPCHTSSRASDAGVRLLPHPPDAAPAHHCCGSPASVGTAEACHAVGSSQLSEQGGGGGGAVDVAEDDLLWWSEVIPDSLAARQTAAHDSVEGGGCGASDVLVPATVVAATATDAAQASPPPASPPQAVEDGHGCNVLGHDEDAVDVEGGSGSGVGAPVPHRRTAPTPSQVSSETERATTASRTAHAARRPRLGVCSAPRQPSPSPRAPSAAVVIVEDVDDAGEEEEEEEGVACAVTSAAAAPWTRHRPLSLSRRLPSSRSPPPVEAAAVVPPQSTSRVHITAGSEGGGDVGALVEPRVSACVRVYVLHDLPHRETRVRRCEAAAAALVRGGAADAATPPLVFVARCEEADVLVTHVIDLRESVLVAIVAGCWVVQPSFLECVAGTLEAARDAGRRPEQQLQPLAAPPAAPQLLSLPGCDTVSAAAAAAATASAVCAARLWETLSRYEWTSVGRTPADAASTTATGPVSDRVAPMQRALVRQCRRQHRRSWGEAVAEDAHAAPRRPVFDGIAALVVMPYGDTVSSAIIVGTTASPPGAVRCAAIARIVETGGGHLSSALLVGCTPADTGVAPPPLRCCTTAPPQVLLRVSEQRRRGGPAAPLVTDEALYHDMLIALGCAVRDARSETLVVLVDGALLSPVDDGAVAVQVVPASREQRPPAMKGPRMGRAATCSSDSGTAPSRGASSVAAWLRGWLRATRDDGDDDEDIAAAADDVGQQQHRRVCYTHAAAHAMRCHISACCAAIVGRTEEERTASRHDAGTYSVEHIPFAVPTVAEVGRACLGDVHASASAAATTASPTHSSPRRVTFCGTGWVGACVAAGGASVVGRSSTAAASSQTWEAHTWWGSLDI